MEEILSGFVGIILIAICYYVIRRIILTIFNFVKWLITTPEQRQKTRKRKKKSNSKSNSSDSSWGFFSDSGSNSNSASSTDCGGDGGCD